MVLDTHIANKKFKEDLRKNISFWIKNESHDAFPIYKKNSHLRTGAFLQNRRFVVVCVLSVLLFVSMLVYKPKEEPSYIGLTKLDRLNIVFEPSFDGSFDQ